MSEEFVVLVDEHDRPTGVMEKMRAHVTGARHRAVSGFLFSPSGELLLQKRASAKYHSGGLWANSCCSHPRPGEAAPTCMARRFREELGIRPQLAWFGSLEYGCQVGHGLSEHELVQGFAGIFQGRLTMNPDEVEDWRWIPLEELAALCARQPASLAPWLRRYHAEGFIEQAWASCRHPGTDAPGHRGPVFVTATG